MLKVNPESCPANNWNTLEKEGESNNSLEPFIDFSFIGSLWWSYIKNVDNLFEITLFLEKVI